MPRLPTLVLAALALAAPAAMARDPLAVPGATAPGTAAAEDWMASGGRNLPASAWVLTASTGAGAPDAGSFAALARDPLSFPVGDAAAPPAGVAAWNEIDAPAPGAAAATAATAVAPRPIPEPNVYALLLAGLAAGAWASRRRRR